MFIPLKDTNLTLRRPVATYTLITLNVCVFLLQQIYNLELFAFSEAAFREHDPFSIFTLISYQFMHGGWGHIMFNMLFLYIFGDNIESSLGSRFFVLFYLVAGAAAALSELYFDPYFGLNNPGVLVGASGSISGILGAYLLRYPSSRILTWVGFILFFKIRAVWFIGLWISLQFFYQLMTPGTGTAYIAHIGGFIAGIIMYRIYHKYRLNRGSV